MNSSTGKVFVSIEIELSPFFFTSKGDSVLLSCISRLVITDWVRIVSGNAYWSFPFLLYEKFVAYLIYGAKVGFIVYLELSANFGKFGGYGVMI